jgi:hypothetical protein
MVQKKTDNEVGSLRNFHGSRKEFHTCGALKFFERHISRGTIGVELLTLCIWSKATRGAMAVFIKPFMARRVIVMYYIFKFHRRFFFKHKLLLKD